MKRLFKRPVRTLRRPKITRRAKYKTTTRTRMARLKRWAGKKLAAKLGAITVPVGGIVATGILLGKNGVGNAADAFAEVAKKTVGLGKAAGGVVAPLLGFLSTSLSYGAKGLEFLSDNLWVIVLGLSALICMKFFCGFPW